MRTSFRLASAGGVFALFALLGFTPAQEAAIPDGIDIQPRGPVHEAFAQPAELRPEPGQPIAKQPPVPIPEEPPEFRPEGANVQFIPGYWAWDAESNQFLWVSGTYRNVPTGRQWVAGQWVNTAEGWRWVQGYWAPEQQAESRYVPEPPAPLQVEPNVPAPSEDCTWVSGNWVYRDTRFVWRPGYWSPFRAGRLWVGSRYVWTPRGYLYNDGYWDYPWEDRGLLFAPVVFQRPYWQTAGWRYRPSYVVNFGLLYDSCFTRPGSFHFYFGNYYGSSYVSLGYRPWFTGHGRYEPAFAYNRWRNNHHGQDWLTRQHQVYADRGAGRLPGPPRTLAQQNTFINNKTAAKSGGVHPVHAVAPLGQAKAINNNINLVRLTTAQVDSQKALAQRTRDISAARGKFDDGAAPRINDKTPFPGSAALKGNDPAQPRERSLPKQHVPDVVKTPQVTKLPQTFKSGGIESPATPRIQDAKPALPKIIHAAPRHQDLGPTPPKVIDGPAPRRQEFAPTSPKINQTPAPRSAKVEPGLPRFAEPKQSAPRQIETPRRAEPPRVTAPSPRSAPPPAAQGSPSRSSQSKGKGKQ